MCYVVYQTGSKHTSVSSNDVHDWFSDPYKMLDECANLFLQFVKCLPDLYEMLSTHWLQFSDV